MKLAVSTASKYLLQSPTMGVGASNGEAREIPNKSTDATLYYFAGRGLADQIRSYRLLISYTSYLKDSYDVVYEMQMDAGSNVCEFHKSCH